MEQSVKPIVVIYLPDNFSISGKMDAPMELMRILNANYGHPVPDNEIRYTDHWNDYLWFCFYGDAGLQSPEFKVFYPKDFTDIQYQELKQLIETEIEKIKTNQQ